MKNPNGYGCIKKLSGNRRKPFAFVITHEGRQVPLSYHATLPEALEAQHVYVTLHMRRTHEYKTLGEIYQEWLPDHIKRYKVSASSINGYRVSFSHLRSLRDISLNDLSYAQLQNVIDAIKGYATRKKVRSLISLLYDYARRMEYTDKNYAGLINIGKKKSIRPHKTFTRQAINRLWKLSDNFDAAVVLILLYTGMRNGELRNLKKSDINRRQRFIRINKSKTEAGKRIIPIHDRIWPLVERLMNNPGSYLLGGSIPLTYDAFRQSWDKTMSLIHGKYTPHDTRHTCASLLDAAEVNDNARKMILGHSRNDVTNGVYTHKTLRQLRKAINKIP